MHAALTATSKHSLHGSATRHSNTNACAAQLNKMPLQLAAAVAVSAAAAGLGRKGSCWPT